MTSSALRAAHRPEAWLCGDHADRARYLDMHARFRRPWAFGLAVGGTTLLVAVWDGWILVVLEAVATLVMVGGVAVSKRSGRPEIVGAVSFFLLELDIAVSVVFSGGVHSALLPLMAVPVFCQAVCFRPVVTLSGVVLSALLATGAVAAAGQDVRPPGIVHLVSYLALLASLSLAAYYLADADLASRARAVVDPLTGLFNRAALQSRFAEVRAQAAALDLPVSLAMCDLDHFKVVNDVHGHDRGDTVLQEVAYRLRKSLRTYDLIYRLGGEEFLVLLPGSDDAAALILAERLRSDISATAIAGLPVTVSVGVSSGHGSGLDLVELTKAADGALYQAKRDGRDRVVAAAPAPVPQGSPTRGDAAVVIPDPAPRESADRLPRRVR